MMIAALMCMTVEILTIQVTAETAEMMVTANMKLDYTFYIKHHKIKDIKLQICQHCRYIL